MAGLLNPKPSEIGHFGFAHDDFRCLPIYMIGHGAVHPAAVSIFLRISFLGEVLSSQIEEPPKQNWWISIVARVPTAG